MPRSARQASESNIYHIMVKGINQSQLFYDDEDRLLFLDRMRRFKQECSVKLYAWSLMGNHVHLLLEIEAPLLATFMKKLLLSYSNQFNKKYERTGYLYQGRFLSKAVEDDRYFLAVLRYIHRNPMEVGLGCSYWTSYDEYIVGATFADTAKPLGMLADDVERARISFADLVHGDGEGLPTCRFSSGTQISDDEAARIICSAAHVDHCTDVCLLSKRCRDLSIIEARRQGLSVRRIARLTGLSPSVVGRAKPAAEE